MTNKKNAVFLLFIIGTLPLEFNGFYNGYISRFPAFFWLVEVMTWIILPVAILACGIKYKLFSFEGLGFHKKVFNKNNTYLFFASLLATAVLALVVDLSSYNTVKNVILNNYGALQFNYEHLVPKTGIFRIIVLLHFCLSAGFVEEIYYRGMFRLLFSDSFKSKLFYVLVSSTIFSSAHWEGGVWNLFEALMVGVFFTLTYLKVKNIWPLIVGHIVVDLYWFY